MLRARLIKILLSSNLTTPQENGREPDIEQGLNNGAEESVDDHGSGLGMVKEHNLTEVAAGGLATVCVFLGIVAMATAGDVLVTFAGIITILLAPYSYYQQRQFTDIQTLKETHEALETEVSHLKDENLRLKGVTEDLGDTIGKLEDIEDTLEMVNSMNATSIAELETQVEDSKLILAEMKASLDADAIQNVITVVLNSDVDGDYKFDESEIEKFIANINGVSGIETNEEEFRRVLEKNHGSVEAIITILQDILNGDRNANDGIFKLTPQ